MTGAKTDLFGQLSPFEKEWRLVSSAVVVVRLGHLDRVVLAVITRASKFQLPFFLLH